MDSTFHHLIVNPRKFYIDNDCYCFEPGSLSDFENGAVLPSVKYDYNLEKDNIYFTNGRIATMTINNNREKNHGDYNWSDNNGAGELFEMLGAGKYFLDKDSLFIETQYCVLTDSAIVAFGPMHFGFCYSLSGNSSWHRELSFFVKWHYGELIIYNGKKHLDIDDRIFSMRHINALDNIVPFAYSKFAHKSQRLVNQPPTKMNNPNPYLDPKFRYLEETKKAKNYAILLNEYFDKRDEPEAYRDMDTIIFQGVDIATYYKKTNFLNGYRIALDSLLTDCDVHNKTNYDDYNNLKYVLGTDDTKLSGDSITVDINLHKITGMTGVALRAGNSIRPKRICLAPVEKYHCVWRFNRKEQEWEFVYDKTEEIINGKHIIIEDMDYKSPF